MRGRRVIWGTVLRDDQRNLRSIVHREERSVFPTQIKAVKKGERAESYGLARKSLHIWRGLPLLHCAALSIDTV